MEYEKIIPGIGPDGITDYYQLKVLICYLINAVSEPVTKSQVNEIIQTNYLANYFDFSQCFEELINSKHLELAFKNDETYYNLTSDGAKTSKVLEIVIPSSVREKVAAAAIQMMSKYKTLAKAKATVKKDETGYVVDFSCLSNGKKHFNAQLCLPDEDMANMIKDNFLKNPDKIYGAVLTLLTGDMVSFKAMLENEKQ
ncbi:MAG: DUF4364 family protein [Clostridia bacterium]